uniref:Synaptogyrin 1 n=1 Tax=Catharus ustulatus TaxID=91951 RepID=A0A8C3U5L3_CATUS
MDGGAFGAGKAGGAFDPQAFIRQPQTILRFVSWVFSIVVFGSIVNEGCLLYLALDAYFPQISSVKDRKKAVLSDIGVSAFWAFLWFVGFCFLTNQWQASKPEDNPLNEGGDAARAAITFSFFSIFTWAGQAFLAYQRFQLGADSALFSQDYMDPSQDSGMPYAPYTNEEDATDAVGTYQQPPPADAFDTETQGSHRGGGIFVPAPLQALGRTQEGSIAGWFPQESQLPSPEQVQGKEPSEATSCSKFKPSIQTTPCCLCGICNTTWAALPLTLPHYCLCIVYILYIYI